MTKTHTSKYVPTLCPVCKKYMKGGANATECNHCGATVNSVEVAVVPVVVAPIAENNNKPRSHEYEAALKLFDQGYVLRYETNRRTDITRSWFVAPVQAQRLLCPDNVFNALLEMRVLVIADIGHDAQARWTAYKLNPVARERIEAWG